jgi:DNA-binding response OmpR family regulator
MEVFKKSTLLQASKLHCFQQAQSQRSPNRAHCCKLRNCMVSNKHRVRGVQIERTAASFGIAWFPTSTESEVFKKSALLQASKSHGFQQAQSQRCSRRAHCCKLRNCIVSNKHRVRGVQIERTAASFEIAWFPTSTESEESK